jgi:HYR domain
VGAEDKHTYNDPIGDTDLAPDIFFITVTHSGKGLSFVVGIANLGPGLLDQDLFALFIDTDRNTHTGCSGDEIVLAVLGGTLRDETAALGRCVGGKWKIGGQGSFSYFSIPGSGIDGPGGLAFSVNVADVGSTNFSFMAMSTYHGIYNDYYDSTARFTFASSSASTSSTGSPPKAQTKPKPKPTPKPPVIAAHPNVRAEATGPSGAKVAYAPAKVTGATKVTYSRRSGSTFPLGNTIVTIAAQNKAGTTRKTFTVSVVDTTPPTLSLLRNVSTNTSGPTATASYGPLQATDRVDGKIAVACSPSSGGVFAPGNTNVSCSARDKHSNKASLQFVVSVPLLSEPLASVQTNTSLRYDGSDLTGATTAITISAPNNPLGDTPSYTWQADSGTIAGNGLSAMWTRESDGDGPLPGTVTITVNHTTGPAHTITLAF